MNKHFRLRLTLSFVILVLFLLSILPIYGCYDNNKENILLARDTWYKGRTDRSKITEINIVNSYNKTGYEKEYWSASQGHNDIICYVNNSTLTIYSKKEIYLNQDSGCLFSSYQQNDKFSNLKTIRGLNLLNTERVVNFGHAFDGCSRLEGELDLSEWDMSKVKSGLAMFQGCGQNSTSPLDIKLPSTLTMYDDFMFNHMTTFGGRTFYIPKAVNKIGYRHVWYNFGTKIQFDEKNNCINLLADENICAENQNFNEFIVDEQNSYFKSVDGILYSFDGQRLICVPGGKKFDEKTFYIPEGVVWINEMAFNRTQEIENLVLPNSYEIARFISPQTHPQFTFNNGSSLNVAIYCYTSIKNFIVKPDNPRYSSNGGCIYSKDGKELIAVPLHYEGELNIADGTEVIGQEAFWVDKNSDGTFSNSAANFMEEITCIIIPKSVKTIENEQILLLNYLLSKNNEMVKISPENTFFKIENNKIIKKT